MNLSTYSNRLLMGLGGIRLELGWAHLEARHACLTYVVEVLRGIRGGPGVPAPYTYTREPFAATRSHFHTVQIEGLKGAYAMVETPDGMADNQVAIRLNLALGGRMLTWYNSGDTA